MKLPSGPWAVEEMITASKAGPVRSWHVHGAKRRFILSVDSQPAYLHEARDIAKLAAASPVLLDALSRMVMAFGSFPTTDIERDALARARAALLEVQS